MGFNSVYRALKELFPTVDARILKAVAIEHSKDADAAAEIVITEILPRFSNFSKDQGSQSGYDHQGPSSGIYDQDFSSNYKHSFGSTPRQPTVFSPKDKFTGSSSASKHQSSSSAFKHPGSSSVPRQPSSFRGIKFREVSPGFKYRRFAPRERRATHEKLMRPHPHCEDINVGNSTHAGSASANSNDPVTVSNVYSNGSNSMISSRKAAGISGEVSVDHATCIDTDKTVCSNGANTDQEKRSWGIGSVEQTGAVKCEDNKNRDDADDVVQEQLDLPDMPVNSVNGVDSICAGAEHIQLNFSTERTIGDLQMLKLEEENQHVDSSYNNTLLGSESSMDQIESTHVKDGIQTAVGFHLPSSSGSGAFNDACEVHCSDNTSALTFEEECPRKEMADSEDPNLKLVIHSGCLCETDVSEDVVEVAKSYDMSIRNDPSAFTSVEECPCGEMVKSEDSYANSVLSQSVQAYRTDILEGIIENAKNYKKTLSSEMETIVSMMREVEYHEKAAEDAKDEAAKGNLAIHHKVDELKRMLPHAKEANDMHAGEVYGEKAILATEVKELQSRLLSLSDEKNNSISVLDEMCQTLKARLSSAEEARKAAEMEKLEREVSANKALAEQEAIMEMVVEESKLIQQQAEENSKLREFLVERGHLVDALQGEIFCVCNDVKLLKEKLDQHLPLSESVSSLPTCRLASSSSSLKSKRSDLIKDRSEASKTILKESAGSSIDDQSEGSTQAEIFMSSNFPSPLSVVEFHSPRTRMIEERVKFDQVMLVDDGWEICGRE